MTKRVCEISTVVALLLVIVGCGSSGGTAQPATNMDGEALTLKAEVPEIFSFTGFFSPGEAGDAVTVRFMASEGTPFVDGTSAVVDVPGVLTSQGAVELTSPLAVVSGSFSATVVVVLPDGTEKWSVDDVVTFFGPIGAEIAPGGALSQVATDFSLTGAGFGPPGADATVRFTAPDDGTPFLQGTANTMDVIATIEDENTILGMTPLAELVANTEASVALILPSGSETALEAPFAFEAPAVTSASPASVPGEVPSPLSVAGSGFGPDGDTVTLRFTAAGTPFANGTSDTLLVPGGTITSATEINATTPVAGVDVSTPATLTVIFSNGIEVSTAGTAITFEPPTLTDFAPATVKSEADTPFTITGTGFGPPGGTVTVHFVGPTGTTPFTDGTSATLEVLGANVISETEITGTTGDADVDVRTAATLKVIFDSGIERTTPNTVVTFDVRGKLVADDAAASQALGGAVAVDGDRALVGAPGDASDTGAAYVFLKQTDGSWTQEAKLTASDGATSDFFGASVAISGDYAVVGAPGEDGAGAAYIFLRSVTGWAQQQKITGTDTGAGDEFGVSVAIDPEGESYVCVGARMEDQGGADAGSVYVFERSGTTWTQDTKLVPSSVAAGHQLGTSVSMAGVYLVAGAPFADVAGTDSGSAYVYERDATTGAWSEKLELTASDTESGDHFGTSVSMALNATDSDVIAVGAPWDDDAGSSSGSAYVFRRDSPIGSIDSVDGTPANNTFTVTIGTVAISQVGVTDVATTAAALVVLLNASTDPGFAAITWTNPSAGSIVATADTAGAPVAAALTETGTGTGAVTDFAGTVWSTTSTKLTASDPAAGDIFGASISTDGTSVIVGAQLNDDVGTASGAAYVFVYDDAATDPWPVQKLVASDAAGADLFGIDVGVSGTAAIVGVPGSDQEASNAGAAYIFTHTGTTWR